MQPRFRSPAACCSSPTHPPTQPLNHLLSPQVTYNTLLASFAHRGAWCEALEALTHVLASAGEGVNPNTGGRVLRWLGLLSNRLWKSRRS